jgi:hypothetical protein
MAKPKFKINNSYASPLNDNYDILGLPKYEYIEMTDPAKKGELLKTEYYNNFAGGDPNNIANYSDLVLTEERFYTRDPTTSLLLYRDQVVKWYLTDNTVGEIKTNRKPYQLKDAIDEGIIRRGNVISAAKLYIMSTVGLANGQTYLAELITQINTYLQGNHQPLIDAVNASTDSFMTPTIKATTVSILTF